MIAADASWLIALIDPEDAHHLAAVAQADELGDEPMILHPLTLAECLVGPARLGRLDEAELGIRSASHLVDFDPESPARFAQIRADQRLRLPDAIVFDTAISHGAGIATFDHALADAARTQGIRVLGDHP